MQAADVLDAVALRVAGPRVLDERVQRPAAIGDLDASVRALDRAEEAGAGRFAPAGHEERLPEREAGRGADEMSTPLDAQVVERHSPPVDEKRPSVAPHGLDDRLAV